MSEGDGETKSGAAAVDPAPEAPSTEPPEVGLVRELCSFEGRGPGTDAERRAANMLAEKLRGLGRRAEVEPVYVHRQFATVHLLHVVLAIAGSLVALREPGVGFAIVLFAGTSAYLDLNARFYLLRSLFYRRASQNVVSPGSNPKAPLRLILVAHYDAGRSGYILGERGRRLMARFKEGGRVLLGPFRIMFWGGMVLLLPVLGARMAGLEGDGIALIQLVPTVILIVSGFLLVDIALSDTVPGAYDNASGVAAVLAAAKALRDEPPPNLDVWVLLTGAGESIGEGMRAWVRANRDELSLRRTLVVNVTGASFGDVHYTVSEGPLISYGMDPELIELSEALAAAAGDGPAPRPLRSPFASEALPARVRGMRAITVTGAEEGLPPPFLHSHADTPDHVDPAAIDRTTDFVVSLARLADRGAERGADPTAVGTPEAPAA